MPRVKREDLVRKIEEVQPGLSPKAIVQQSNCIGFVAGELITFNEDIACRTKSGLGKEVKGAVQAAPLLEMLRNYPDEDIDVSTIKDRFIIRGKKRLTRFAMEPEVLLPLEAVEKPGEWVELHKDFTEAVTIVQECASTDKTHFDWTCVHITPEYMEACDDHQLARYNLPTGIKKPILVKRDSLKHVPILGVTQMSEMSGWLHFRSPTGLIMSCVKNDGDYDDLSKHFNVKGKKIVLPKVLAEVVSRADILSRETADKNLIHVEAHGGEIKIRGEGAIGEHIETKRVKYSGPDLSFAVAPKLLSEIVTKHTDALISEDRKLKVDGGRWVYMAVLLTPRVTPGKPKKEKK